MEVKHKGNAVFDYMKFGLSVLIVVLHTKFLYTVLNPWLRLAVPLFFIVSSYFFFGKIGKVHQVAEQRAALWNFCKRNLQLYAFWFVALLPIVLYIHRWFDAGILYGIVLFLRDLVFSSTFSASWFIMALVIATVLVFFASRKVSNGWLLGIAFFVYLITTVFSAYTFLVPTDSALSAGMTWYTNVFAIPSNSFPVALFWVTVGKCFADGTLDAFFAKIHRWVFLAVGLLLLYGEWAVVRHFSGALSRDCYVMLAFVVPVIFYMIKGISLETNATTLFLRQASTVIYAVHCSAMHVLRPLFRAIGCEYNGLLFVVITLGCIAAAAIIVKLEKKKGFRWLKYAH